MIRSVLAGISLLLHLVLALILIAGLVAAAFVAYRGSQPMRVQGGNGLTYWQFLRERIGAIRELPSKCQQMHLIGYLFELPTYYINAGVITDSFLARITVNIPLFRKRFNWLKNSQYGSC